MSNKWHQVKHYFRHVIQARRQGHGVHSPFAYRLCEDVFYNASSFYHFAPLENIRKLLLHDKTTLSTEDYGAGSRVFKGRQRRIKDIAAHGISRPLQSQVLYKLLNFLNCNTCVELGTSLGLNTLYLASVNRGKPVVSIEGSPGLHAFATELVARQGFSNVQLVCGRFSEELGAVLKTNAAPYFVYVDGEHTYEATIRHFYTILMYADAESVIVFDDIYWSEGMTLAWEEIKKHQRVKMSIDLFYMGIIFFKDEIKEPVHLKLFI